MRAAIALLAALSVHLCDAQMEGMPRKPKPMPMDSDIKYIKCQTCELMAAKALTLVKDAAAAEKPKPQQKRRFESSSSLGGLEASVEDIVTNICNSESSEGTWLSEYDIVKRDRALKLESQVDGDVVGGKCRRECRTIEKACAGILEAVDDELADLLLAAAKAKKSAGMLKQRVCTKMAGVCKKGKTPLWPEGKVRRNEEFKPKTKKDKETEALLSELQGMQGGQGLSMMTGDELDLGDDSPQGDGLKDEV